MTIILGIDPGSRCTGYGIISSNKSEILTIAYGQIHTNHKSLATRLHNIHEGIQQIIMQHQPNEVAIEQVFMSENAQSALKLGHARGVAMLAAAQACISIAEYSPRQIKQAVVGYGNASKIQMQMMIRALLHLKETPPSDAADALAVALCHSHSRRLAKQLQTIA